MRLLGVVHLFEDRLKQQHPHVRNITYDVADLNAYIDNLADLSALVYDKSFYMSYFRIEPSI